MTSDLIRRNIWWTAKNKNLDFSIIRSSKIAILKVVDRAENILSARINDRQKKRGSKRSSLFVCMWIIKSEYKTCQKPCLPKGLTVFTQMIVPANPAGMIETKKEIVVVLIRKSDPSAAHWNPFII